MNDVRSPGLPFSLQRSSTIAQGIKLPLLRVPRKALKRTPEDQEVGVALPPKMQLATSNIQCNAFGKTSGILGLSSLVLVGRSMKRNTSMTCTSCEVSMCVLQLLSQWGTAP